MKAKARVVHSIPGRTRVRVHNRRHDKQFFQEIENRLARLPQVESVETEPLTGSILVHHAGPAFELLLAAVEAGFDELLGFESSAPVARQLRSQVTLFDELIRRTSAGQLDLNTVAMFGLFTLAGVQLVQGNQPIIAVTLAWYASELLRRWEEPSTTKTR